MILSVIILIFLLMLRSFKSAGINITKSGKVHGVIIIFITKLLFWLCLIFLTNFWLPPEFTFYIAPVFLFIFGLYLFLDRRLLFYPIRKKKIEI